MPTLLIRHGYGIKHVSEKHTERVPIAMGNGQQHYTHFAGFIEQTKSVIWSELAKVRKVKINNVYGFSKTDGYFDVTYFGNAAVALGYYSMLSKTVTVPLISGLPLVWCDVNPANHAKNIAKVSNAVELFIQNSKQRDG